MRISIIKSHPKKAASGQVLTEACIGLALMTFTWIIMSYSLFMADNHIRTAMAARFAAWYRAAAKKPATKEQLNDLFYFTPVADVVYTPGQDIGDLLSASHNDVTSKATDYKADTSTDGPFLATVTYGVTDVNDPATPFPFDLLRTKVPFMPDSLMDKCLSVRSFCQWDGVGETWTSAGHALKAAYNMLKGIVTKFF